MKKIKLTFLTILTLTFANLFFQSCSDELELETKNENIELRLMNSEESSFIENLNNSLKTIESKTFSKENINNSSNYMNDYGLYTFNMLNELYSEITTSSETFTQEDINNKISFYNSNIPQDINIPTLENVNSKFFITLSEISNQIFSNEQNIDLLITKITIIENNLIQTNLLNQTEKTNLLAFCSSLKYTSLFINQFNSSSLRKTNCVDNVMVQEAGDNFSILVNFDESPFATTFAWTGLPLTIIAPVGDALYQTVKQCL